MKKAGYRWAFFVFSILWVYTACIYTWTGGGESVALRLLFAYVLIFPGWLGVWLFFPDGISKTASIYLILFIAAGARLCLWDTVDYSPLAMKAMILFFDMLALAIIMLVLRYLHYSVRMALLYALNPIVLFVFSLGVHYGANLWYLIWFALVIGFSPSLSFLWISFAGSLYFLADYQIEQGLNGDLPVWALWVQWVPFLILLIYENRNIVSRITNRKRFTKPRDYAVIIPVYNDALKLEDCLRSLKKQNHLPREIIVIDGGSTDRPSGVASAFGASFFECARRGRGLQIADGIRRTQADVIVVVHADTTLPQEAVRAILRYFERNLSSPGGVLGQRFDGGGGTLLIVEALNDMRAAFGGTGFGDQVQFFRRDALSAVGGYPEYPLMEDVELSLRLLRCGSLGFLSIPAYCSARRWQSLGFIKRSHQVLTCVIRYRWARLRGRDISAELYSFYYEQ